jgi:hypothetical protein
MNPSALAYLTVLEVMERGTAKGHPEDGWKSEPVAMHIQKAARHGLTCLLLSEHPDYTKDPETAREHLEQMLTRAALALAAMEIGDGK